MAEAQGWVMKLEIGKNSCLRELRPLHFQRMSLPRSNYIYVDYENIHEVPLDNLKNKPVWVTLVVGMQQKNLPIRLVQQLKDNHEQVHLLETGCSGKNALDLVLAFHIGKKASADPEGYFHIISADKAFDALVKHLRTQGILAARHLSMNAVPALQNLEKFSILELMDSFRSKLEIMKGVNGDARPKKEKTLKTCMMGHFNKRLPDTKIEAIFKELQKGGWLATTPEGKISYRA